VRSLQGYGEYGEVVGQEVLHQGRGPQDRRGQVRKADGALQGAQHAHLCVPEEQPSCGRFFRR